jgi:hypothetical protein
MTVRSRTHSFRPVRLTFETENSASIQAENERLKQEISSLENFSLCKDLKVELKFKGLLTTVDGKVVSALTNQNTCRCNICDKSGPLMAKKIKGPFHYCPRKDCNLEHHLYIWAFEALHHT